VPTITHGRVLVRAARAAASRGLIVGFHGYMENAGIQFARLEALPGSSRWTVVSIQGLHRFYRGRTEEVVASWMTREDRDVTIADNLDYVGAALDAVPHDRAGHIVYVGFSQGAAMAFRAAARSGNAADVIAVGGDVPPELLQERWGRFPRVLLARGDRDNWYTQEKFDADVKALTGVAAVVRPLTYDGAHEWNAEVERAAGEFLSADSSHRS